GRSIGDKRDLKATSSRPEVAFPIPFGSHSNVSRELLRSMKIYVWVHHYFHRELENSNSIQWFRDGCFDGSREESNIVRGFGNSSIDVRWEACHCIGPWTNRCRSRRRSCIQVKHRHKLRSQTSERTGLLPDSVFLSLLNLSNSILAFFLVVSNFKHFYLSG